MSKGNDNKLSILKLLKRKLLKDICENICRATELYPSIYDSDGTPVIKATRSIVGRNVCWPMRKALSEADTACEEYDKKAIRNAIKRGRPYKYSCHLGFREVAVPILVGGRTCGVVFLGKIRVKGTLRKAREQLEELGCDPSLREKLLAKIEACPTASKEDIDIAVQHASFTARTISEFAHDAKELRQASKRLRTLHIACRRMAKCKDPASLMRQYVDQALEVVQCQSCVVWLYDKQADALSGKAWKGGLPEEGICTFPLDMGFVGWLASGRKLEHYEPDIHKHIRSGKAPAVAFADLYEKANIHSFLAHRFGSSKTYGVFELGAEATGAFDKEDQQFFTAFSRIAELWLEHLFMHEELNKQSGALMAIDLDFAELQSGAKLDKTMKKLLQKGLAAISCNSGHIRLSDVADNLWLTAQIGEPSSGLRNPIRAGEGVCGKAFRKRRYVYVRNWPKYRLGRKLVYSYGGGPPEDFARNIKSAIAIPFLVGGDVIGTLCAHSPIVDGFSEEDRSFLRSLARRAAYLISTHRLVNLANTWWRAFTVVNEIQGGLGYNEIAHSAVQKIESLGFRRVRLYSIERTKTGEQILISKASRGLEETQSLCSIGAAKEADRLRAR
jgi:ligand-binding sensor protein/putative methionine-R-sulfoxide reductase with GAF domain